MNKLTKLLVVILAAQIGLVLLTRSSGAKLATFVPNEPLLAIDRSAVVKISIADPQEPNAKPDQAAQGAGDNKPLQVELAKVGERWTTNELNFPVSATKLQQVLDTLFEAKRSLPVTTTKAGSKQLKVSADDFERKVTLSDKDGRALHTLHFGNSPGFKKTYIRLDDEVPTYTVNFGVFELSASAKDWFDREILSFESESVSEINFPTFSLKNKDNIFSLDGKASDESDNAEQIRDFVQRVKQLSYTEVLGDQTKPEYQLSPALVEFNVVKKTGEKVTYSFGKIVGADGKDEERVLKLSNLPYFFKVAKGTVDTLAESNRAALVKKAGSNEQGAEAVNAESGPSQPDPVASAPAEEVAGAGQPLLDEETMGTTSEGAAN